MDIPITSAAPLKKSVRQNQRKSKGSTKKRGGKRKQNRHIDEQNDDGRHKSSHHHSRIIQPLKADHLHGKLTSSSEKGFNFYLGDPSGMTSTYIILNNILNGQ